MMHQSPSFSPLISFGKKSSGVQHLCLFVFIRNSYETLQWDIVLFISAFLLDVCEMEPAASDHCLLFLLWFFCLFIQHCRRIGKRLSWLLSSTEIAEEVGSHHQTTEKQGPSRQEHLSCNFMITCYVSLLHF